MSRSLPLISLVDVHRIFRVGKLEVHALRGVTVTVDRGEFVSIMGPSGSGKSTLMNIIGCLDRPTSGTYHLSGQDVSRLSERALAEIRNRRIGFIFQSFNLLPSLTARENVELPLIYRGITGAIRRRLAEAALERVGLSHRINHRPLELSGGEQQRVAIARALVGKPRLILADEPTGNLDSRTGAEIMALFQQLNEEENITIIQVTHDPDMARHGKRLLYLRDGAIVSDTVVEDRLRGTAVLAALGAQGEVEAK